MRWISPDGDVEVGWLKEYEMKGFWAPNQPSSNHCAIRICGRYMIDVGDVRDVSCFILLS